MLKLFSKASTANTNDLIHKLIMGELADKVITAGRERIGTPFVDHFEPQDTCAGGEVTLVDYMERGMDQNGFDCSGFVIASICDVLHMRTCEWPQQLRHAQQMMRLAVDSDPQRGDVLITPILGKSGDTPVRYHARLISDINHNKVLHANRLTDTVAETVAKANIQAKRALYRRVPLKLLVEYVTR